MSIEMCHTVRTTVHGAEGVAVARAEASEGVSHAYDGAEALCDDVAVVASELVSNAVQARASRVVVSTRMHTEGVWVEVTDDAAGFPQLRPVSHDRV